MSRGKVAAPVAPAVARGRRLGDLQGKGNRSAAETRELVDLLVDEVADLRARLDRLADRG